MRRLLNALGGWLADRIFPHPTMTIVVNVFGSAEPERIARDVSETLAARFRAPKG